MEVGFETKGGAPTATRRQDSEADWTTAIIDKFNEIPTRLA